MRLADVNVLVYAFRADSSAHKVCRRWLEGMVRSEEAFAVSDQVLAGFLRVLPHPRVFNPPTPLAKALEFARILRDEPNAVAMMPEERHWDIFTKLCRGAEAKGNLVPDAWLAALAIESGCELITMDRDFARFEGLRWSSPV